MRDYLSLILLFSFLLNMLELGWALSGTELILRRKRESRSLEGLPEPNSGSSSVLTSHAEGALFTTRITFGGIEFDVDVDTGSSDLWIVPKPSMSGVSFSEVSASVVYGTGSVNGTVAYAPLTLGTLHAEEQAFIHVTEATDMSGLLQFGSDGILGLGFATTSTGINRALSAAHLPFASSNALTTLLSFNPSLPRMYTALLNRNASTGHGADGLLTVGTYAPELHTISRTPRFPRFVPAGAEYARQPRWTVLADGVAVDGRAVPLRSAFPGAPAGTNVALLDTGTTLSAVPRAVADAVYAAVPGAYVVDGLTSDGSHDWVVPCATPVRISFSFAGQEIPIHPLDATKLRIASVPRGIYCTGTLQSTGTALQGAGIDMLLGDSFLLNAYSAYHLGESASNTPEKDVPYVQLLPLTDAVAALDEFTRIRLDEIRELALPELTKAQMFGEEPAEIDKGQEEVPGVQPAPIPIDDKPAPPSVPVDELEIPDIDPGPPLPSLDAASREDALPPLHTLPEVRTAGGVGVLLLVVVGMALLFVFLRRKNRGYAALRTEEYALVPPRLD